MFAWTDLAAYCAVVALLFLIPGPAVLLTLARAMAGGPRAGIATGLGIAAGDAVHTLMAVIGLSAVLMTSALAFDIVKYLGAAYLIYLGIRALMERSAGDLALPTVRPLTGPVIVRQAFLTEILNPKTALFFLSFLPQFVDPARGPVWMQLLALGGIFVAMSIAYTSLLAWAAGSFAAFLKRNRAVARWQNKVIGSLYVGLGLQLAFQQRH